MALSIERYMAKEGTYRVLDFGSGTSRRQTLTHRSLLSGYDYEYTGVDIREADNVDLVMKKPYRIPVRSRSFDIVLSGQVFEHIPLFWASLLEIARVMKPEAYFFLTVPSRGHVHSTYDCWRFSPDGLRAMAAWSQLSLREAFSDFPPPIRDAARAPRRRHDFAAIDSENYYWGDTVGVFQKPARSPALRAAIVRPVVRAWANRVASLDTDAGSAPAGRADVLGVTQH